MESSSRFEQRQTPHSDDDEARDSRSILEPQDGTRARESSILVQTEQQEDQYQNAHEDRDHDAGDTTPTDTSHQEFLPRDQQTRTAYYNRASEKSLSQAEAKLFYQRHQLETSQHEQQTQSPLLSGRTLPSSFDGETAKLSRTASITSPRSARSAVPSGTATTEKPVHNIDAQPRDHSHLESHASNNNLETNDQSISTSQPLRSHADHSRLHDRHKSPISASEGVRSSGAGIESYKTNDGVVASELSVIYTNIQKVLDIRHKYIRLSLQGSSDNPKDDPSWNIYPPPPEPVWDDDKDRPIGSESGANSLSNSKVLSSEYDRPGSNPKYQPGSATGDQNQQLPPSPARKRRKPGQDIGEDFDMSDLLPLPEEAEMTFKLDPKSVYQVYENANSEELETPILNIPTIRDFYMDLDEILNVSSDGPSKSFAFRRLQYLEGKFNLYVLLNGYQEVADSKRVPHRDFYNVRKVDTHVHHSACMNQKHLLRFIKSKMKKSPDEIVMFRDGKHLTLKEVFESINLTAYDLSIDTLDMHVCWRRFRTKLPPEGRAKTQRRLIQTRSIVLTNSTSSITR